MAKPPREKQREYGQTYEQKDPARRREQKRLAAITWRKKHPERAKAANEACGKKRKERDPDLYRSKLNAAARKRYVTPTRTDELRVYHRIYMRYWRKLNPDKVIQSNHRSRELHGDKCREATNKWIKSHPEQYADLMRKAHHKRRALLAGQPLGGIPVKEWKEKLQSYEHKCVYCGKNGPTLDHVIALAAGGQDHIDNAVPACKRCNSSKRDKSLSKWLAVSKIAQQALVNYPESLLKTIIPNKNS